MAASIMSVESGKIVVKGIIPEIDPNYDNKDPLNLLCWQVKSELIDKYNVCIYYQIMRKLNLNGENTIEITFFLSYTGKYEGHEGASPDEPHWLNEYSIRVASLLEAFILDFNNGEKCALIKEPEKCLTLRQKEEKNPYIKEVVKVSSR